MHDRGRSSTGTNALAMPNKTAELRKLLRDYLGSVDAQMPKPNPDANGR